MGGKDLNNTREQILKNLRQSPLQTSQKPMLPAHRDAWIYRSFEAARQNPLQAFAQKIATLKGEFYHVQDELAAAKTLREILSSVVSPASNSVAVARHRHVLLDRIFAADSWLWENVQIIDDQKISSADFANFTAGVTAVDFLVARTGSVVLSTATAGGRRLSVLPPFHVAIATTEQVVVSLDEALQLYYKRDEPNRSSYATIITGPSRTSDIEKILVLGAHGPKRLAVLVVG
ncbi:MAG: LUD domain-containing protein [candidate division KSB1 bacterium]|nr:LUD domain-containing protein [candidate division KSB1 bacterium]MDZ7365545.1 LUD domain-containing protein [candidate division KSB1 bacterium]MDZ7403648.1 LUD domain-containing protein [candidate division KSB1 bacterium]